MSDLRSDLETALSSVAKDWKKAKRKADRNDRVSRRSLYRMRSYSPPRQTIRDAAFRVMKQAIDQASGEGRYMANARQIMYQARPLVLEITGGEIWKDSSYFTQTLLKDYIEYYGGGDRIVWDARGHLKEPYTNKVIPLGGADVMNYIQSWNSEFSEYQVMSSPVLIKTVGPKHRFSSVLFIEKEGFYEILEDAGIAEKYDMAIMSTKGVPVGAACDLAACLSSRLRIFVLHDFDLAGFKILKTLRHGARLSSGAHVTDIGFRLDDIDGLPSEPVTYRQKKDPKIYLRGCGATEDERAFLVQGRSYRYWEGQRVELNAMTTEQLIEFLDSKFEEQGVEKVIPDEETLMRAYKRAIFLQAVDKATEEIKDQLEESTENDARIPENLADLIQEKINGEPLSWDDAIWEIAEEEAADTQNG